MEIKKTITSIFMVPTLKVGKERLTENNFINAYSKDGSRDVQYENAVYLLFKPKDIDRFKEFMDGEYERTKAIIDDYDYEDGYVVAVYSLDEKFKRDFKLVEQGAYSKTSPEFQALFPKVIKIKKNGLHKDEISLQYRVFNKTEDLRKFWEDKLDVEFDDDMEVWGAFIEEDETLNLDKIKEYV
jgi:hypothetical protein